MQVCGDNGGILAASREAGDLGEALALWMAMRLTGKHNQGSCQVCEPWTWLGLWLGLGQATSGGTMTSARSWRACGLIRNVAVDGAGGSSPSDCSAGNAAHGGRSLLPPWPLARLGGVGYPVPMESTGFFSLVRTHLDHLQASPPSEGTASRGSQRGEPQAPGAGPCSQQTQLLHAQTSQRGGENPEEAT